MDESVSRDEALQTPGLDPLMSNFTLAASSGLLDPPPQLKYHELGMLAQMDEAAKSFLVNNNLSPLRVMLWGPPLSGKTALAEVIAKQYSLRRISFLLRKARPWGKRFIQHRCLFAFNNRPRRVTH